MDCPQVAKSVKKRGNISTSLGRPKKGALSTFPKKIIDEIYNYRDKREGWGPQTILVELQEEHGYSLTELPSTDSINRYLKQKGFIKKKEPRGKIPIDKCPKSVKHYHDLWEMDAEGAVRVGGLGYISNINIKDAKSKVHCMAFPVHVKGQMSQPKTASYFWALRLAFEQWGLPKAIQVDKDSVFIDNTSKSPFPSRLHLWLIGLGIKLCFIDVPPPKKQAMVERSHQTLHRQTIKGQHYDYWKQLFLFTNKRRKRMNEKLPNRMLQNKAPLQFHPKAKHSNRPYEIRKEEKLLNMDHIYRYLAKCNWYRRVSNVKTISLNAKVYYLKNAQPKTQLQITFCAKSKKLIFRDDKELVVAKLPMKNLDIQNIMDGTTESLISMKQKLFRDKDFPL